MIHALFFHASVFGHVTMCDSSSMHDIWKMHRRIISHPCVVHSQLAPGFAHHCDSKPLLVIFVVFAHIIIHFTCEERSLRKGFPGEVRYSEYMLHKSPLVID